MGWFGKSKCDCGCADCPGDCDDGDECTMCTGDGDEGDICGCDTEGLNAMFGIGQDIDCDCGCGECNETECFDCGCGQCIHCHED